MAIIGQRAVNSRNRGNQMPLLQDRLILNRLICRQFGFDNFKNLREYLRQGRHTEQEGRGEDGHNFFFHVLKNLPECQLSPDKLAEYDLRIKGYLDRLNRFRTPSVELKYFQYLALLFTEIYLARLFNEDDILLTELNDFGREENERASGQGLPYSEFTRRELNKLAFWMATGSGKTLIMHINLWQYMYYSKRAHRNILLVTPNEGLSRQHLEQFRLSGIAAVRHGEDTGLLAFSGAAPVTVIEITKLTEKKRGGGLSVEVDAFGPDNLLFVDEGHRGASGEVWRELRRRLAEKGFTFEYSATFGQIVNGASREKRRDLLDEYSGAILFDYSYPYFHGDGYGKDYYILNLRDETSTFNDLMLLGNLLSFYEQILVYDENGEDLRPFNVEKPLWVFVGHSVTGRSSRQDRPPCPLWGHHQKDENHLALNFFFAAGEEVELSWCFEPEG